MTNAPKAILILAFSFFAAWSSFGASYTLVTRLQGKPGLVDPVSLTERGRNLVMNSEMSQTDYHELSRLADTALRLQALNPLALTLKSLTLSILRVGQSKCQDQLLRLSFLGGRREPLNHLVRIESFVSRNDIKSTLESYDLALRTSSQSSNLLFPILATAVTDGDIRQGLVPYMKRKTNWIPPFFIYAASNPVTLKHLAEIVLISNGFGDNDPDGELSKSLIASLYQGKYSELSKRLFLLDKRTKKAVLTSASLSRENFEQRAGSMGWRLTEAASFGALVASDGGLTVYAEPNAQGTVAQKALFLSSGNYRVEIRKNWTENSTPPSLLFRVICTSKEGHVSILYTKQLTREKGGSGLLSVGNDCPTQSVTLSINGVDGQQESRARISSIEIDRLPSSLPL